MPSHRRSCTKSKCGDSHAADQRLHLGQETFRLLQYFIGLYRDMGHSGGKLYSEDYGANADESLHPSRMGH